MEKRIVDFVTGAQWHEVPQLAREVLKLSLLDWCAVALKGMQEPVSRMVTQMVLNEGATAVCTLIGRPDQVPARAAALANGTQSHALDYDDTHFLHIGHPSVVIFPASLAMAQISGSTGQDFLTSALIGIEASCRIGHWLGRSHYEAGFHMTATAGSFGAGLAAGRLMQLDQGQLHHVLGLLSTKSSGLKNQFGTMGKPYNAGMAAANGVEAVQLCAAGFISNPNGLAGFGSGHNGDGNLAAFNGMGQDFVTTGISHKFHACCHGTHAMLEALAMLPQRTQPVQAVEITVHPRWLKVCNQPNPTTGLEAKFSYRMCAAFALGGLGTGALETFSDANCADETLCALRDLVTVKSCADLPDGAARVAVTLADGIVQQADYDLDKPVDIATRRAKVQRKAAGLVGVQKSKALWAKIEGLEQAKDLSGLANLLAR